MSPSRNWREGDPRLSKDESIWLAERSDGVNFWARHRNYLETFLDPRCQCTVKQRCHFHMDNSLFDRDADGAATGLKEPSLKQDTPLRVWDSPPTSNSLGQWSGHRSGDPENFWFFSTVSREHLETMLNCACEWRSSYPGTKKCEDHRHGGKLSPGEMLKVKDA